MRGRARSRPVATRVAVTRNWVHARRPARYVHSVNSELLPVCAMDLIRLSPAKRLFYAAVIGAHRAVGAWRRNAPRSGDFATMSWLDIAYWMHKSERPIRLAARGSGLDVLSRARAQSLPLPNGFVPADTVTLAAAGDLMTHAFLRGSTDVLYEAVHDEIFSADLTLANLEGVLHPERERIGSDGLERAPALHLEAAALDAVTGHRDRRYSVLSLANNHTLDHGAGGALATRRHLQSRGIAHHGVNESEADAAVPLIATANGIRVAVLSWTFGLNGEQPEADTPWLVNCAPLNDAGFTEGASHLAAQITAARRDADLVVASLHWGMEFELFPREQQQQNAHALAELGIDVILGHHPHVVQPVELYRTKRDPRRVVPIFYSLGNLTNPCSVRFMCEALVARLTAIRGVTDSGETRTYITELDPRWVCQRVDHTRRQVRLEPFQQRDPLQREAMPCPS